MAIDIKQISKDQASELFGLAAKVENHFVTEAWCKTNETTLLLGVFSDSKLIGGAILVKSSLKGVSALLNVHGMPHLGLFVDPSSFPNPNLKVSERDLSKALAGFLSSRKEKIKLIRFSPLYTDLLPLYWSGFILQTKYTYQIDLTASNSELWDQLHPKLRSSIKKVLENECEINDQDSLKAKELILKANNKLNTKSLNLINETLNCLENIPQASITTMKNKGEIVAAACTFISDDKMYYLFGGANKDKSGFGAALLWEQIVSAQNLGLKKFDFEGSMLPGVEKFFRQFGGTLTPYQTATQAPLHFEFLLKLLKKS